jgi:hypothetical protein
LFGFRPPIVILYVSQLAPRPPRFSMRDTSIVDGILIVAAIITGVALAACLVLLLLGLIG